ncbi:serine/threonine-protein kinase [Streptomyces sp. CA-135486]|uniref:serine/threonine-protein kinase n=1 Tax=Streptomyces sp. CA-135486 TaxID=3240049 RepID=UPI003D8A645A
MNTRGADRRLIDGRFELLGRLGSGGMGTVWRARDIVLHREVALKEVRPADPAMHDADPARARMLSERVLREARALARLAHPHVVAIHHIVEGADGPYPWIVMELVRGQSLHDRLVQGPLTVPEALTVARGVLAALRAAHAEGIQHRDVKPANVLLRPDGSAVLTDFGIAALRESAGLTATGDLIGSPEYIAPERIRGEEGNPASDLWSLGMLLYVALEGGHPLRRATSMSTLVAVLDDPIPAPVRSGALTPVLNALLVREVAARPDAAQVERMLADAGSDALRWTPAPPAAAPSVPQAAAPVQPAQPGPYGPPPSDIRPPGFGPPLPVGAVPDALGRPPRKPWKTTAVAVSAAAAITAVSVIALNIIPDERDSAKPKATSTATSGATDGATGTPQPDKVSLPPSKETKNLLTPAGVRDAIKALKAKTRTTKFFEFTVYKDYAIAEVPVQGSRKKYDRYVFRNGYATSDGPGGTAFDSDSGPIDVSKVNWDTLPALIKKADQELGISRPTMRYVIVRGPVFEAVPTVNVYLIDEYSSTGYLAADFSGSVLNKVAAEN